MPTLGLRGVMKDSAYRKACCFMEKKAYGQEAMGRQKRLRQRTRHAAPVDEFATVVNPIPQNPASECSPQREGV